MPEFVYPGMKTEVTVNDIRNNEGVPEIVVEMFGELWLCRGSEKPREKALVSPSELLASEGAPIRVEASEAPEVEPWVPSMPESASPDTTPWSAPEAIAKHLSDKPEEIEVFSSKMSLTRRRSVAAHLVSIMGVEIKSNHLWQKLTSAHGFERSGRSSWGGRSEVGSSLLGEPTEAKVERQARQTVAVDPALASVKQKTSSISPAEAKQMLAKWK